MRVERIGAQTLILGDMMDVLPTLGKFDACVTDPPYGIGWDRQAEKDSGRKPGCSAATKGAYVSSGWDDAPITDEHLSAIIHSAACVIIFGGNYFNLPPARCWLVWDKKTGANEFADCELAWTNLDKPVRRIEWMWNGMLRRGQEERNGHPTQKPIEVMRWCIGHLPNPRTIVDPFCGSGTAIVAAAKMGLSGTGIERDEQYFDIACRRVEEANRQPRDFFIEPPAPAEQIDMFGATK